jgi:hypothetical protein
MKVVARTDEYTIYQKRSERYAVRDSSRAWVNGDAKVAILLQHKLIEAPKAKAPAPEAASPEATTEESAAEAPAAEAPAAEAPAAEEAEKSE